MCKGYTGTIKEFYYSLVQSTSIKPYWPTVTKDPIFTNAAVK